MTFSTRIRHCAPLALLLWGPLALAADGNFTLDPERAHPYQSYDEPVGAVVAVPLPPWPKDADLIAFTVDGPERPFRFSIDGKNLSTDPRGEEVRYTLVIESKTGVRNVTFEAMRCTLKGAYKVLAYGADGRFSRAPEQDWQPIAEEGSEAYRDDLRRHRFCVPRETRARPVKDMLRALRGRVSANESTGFQAQ